MGRFIRSLWRSSFLLGAVSFIGLSGCQSMTWIPGVSPSQSNSTPAPSNNNFLPSMTNNALDGSGPGQSLELPTQKKIEACQATAQLMERSGKFPEAIAYYEQLRSLDPRKSLIYTRHLAILYDRKGDFDKALDEYHKLIAANPKDADAHNDLGYGYYTRGKFEAAEKSLRRSVELDPKSKRAWSNLGMTLAQLKRYDEALAAFEKSVTKAQGLCNIGFIQAAQGNWLEARDSYAHAIQLEPGLQKARAALEQIQNGRPTKGRDRQEAKRRGLERPPAELESARGLPFGGAAGAVGADADMIYISGADQPIHLPMPASFNSPNGSGTLNGTVAPVAPPAPVARSAGGAPSPALPPAPSPSALSVD